MSHPPECRRIGTAELWLADCRDILERLEYGALVADPPYGIGYQRGKRKTLGNAYSGTLENTNRHAATPIHGDDSPFDPGHLFARQVPTVIFGADYYRTRLPDGGSFICWDKSIGLGPADDFKDAEFAWANFPVRRNVLRVLWKGVACQKAGEENGRRYHPTTKPQTLMLKVLDLLPAFAGAVCDPYMGSGSTGVACAKRGLPFVGVEVDPRYFEIACERIDDAQRQGNLLAGSAA